MDRYIKRHPSKWQSRYTEEFKQHVIKDFLIGGLTRREIEHKYKIGNSRLTYWLRAFGHETPKPRLLSLEIMPESSNTNQHQSSSEAKLKKELEDAKLLAEAYRRMIEKAEQELKINIRKKSSTK
ncbi:MAG: hypothetical protein JKY52_07480 [Flavobacteriales bacterium]|nr:hypothetical protein [Flavobacteriales bacterium]